MNKSYICKRNKWKMFGLFVLMLLVLALFVFFGFFNIRELGVVDTNFMYYFLKVLSIVFIPVMLFSCFAYFKMIFSDKPILKIDEYGITDYSSVFSVGLIKWIDIKDIFTIPYMDNTYFICIHLKKPEKYIKSKKRVERIKKKNTLMGQINISSMFFKKDFKEVCDLLKYYFDKAKAEYGEYFDE